MINDDNIDLTENRDFRGSIRPIGGVHLFEDKQFWNKLMEREQKRVFGALPWNVYPIDNIYKFDGLVALGNSRQRIQAIELYYWGTSDALICDCCGKEYKKIPWKSDSGLCRECRAYYQEHKEISFPWNSRIRIQ